MVVITVLDDANEPESTPSSQPADAPQTSSSTEEVEDVTYQDAHECEREGENHAPTQPVAVEEFHEAQELSDEEKVRECCLWLFGAGL